MLHMSIRKHPETSLTRSNQNMHLTRALHETVSNFPCAFLRVVLTVNRLPFCLHLTMCAAPATFALTLDLFSTVSPLALSAQVVVGDRAVQSDGASKDEWLWRSCSVGAPAVQVLPEGSQLSESPCRWWIDVALEAWSRPWMLRLLQHHCERPWAQKDG